MRKRVAWNKGLTGIYTDEQRRKISETLKEKYRLGIISAKGNKNGFSGKKHSDETKLKWNRRSENNGRYIDGRAEYDYVVRTGVHRMVMVQNIGRELKKTEIVHHIDGNKRNNKINNLCLFRSRSAHSKLHRFAERHKLPIFVLKFNQDWLYIT